MDVDAFLVQDTYYHLPVKILIGKRWYNDDIYVWDYFLYLFCQNELNDGACKYFRQNVWPVIQFVVFKSKCCISTMLKIKETTNLLTSVVNHLRIRLGTREMLMCLSSGGFSANTSSNLVHPFCSVHCVHLDHCLFYHSSIQQHHETYC